MKSYLSLIPISARLHKRQNFMTRLCIIFAVFLVTAIFSMADMGIRMEKLRLLQKHGILEMKDFMSNTTVHLFYGVAAFLFIIILIAGILMISGSINSNVAQRTKFFGMMRCIGMSRQQVIHFVRLEALNWCKTAIPIGLSLGTLITWGLCAVLKFFVSGEFSEINIFGISPIGIISGAAMGVATVLIAASAPAKRAAKVSPVSALTDYLDDVNRVYNIGESNWLKVETKLGICHAVSSKKNLILMTASFALSILLFLSFSVLIEFIGYLMPQTSNTSDIDISSIDGLNSLDKELLNEIGSLSGVKRIYGRRNSLDISAEINQNVKQIDIISYDVFDLDCLIKDKQLKKGSDISKVYGDSDYVLTIYDENSSLEIGDKIKIENAVLEIAGMLRMNPFQSDGGTDGKVTLIVSAETFTRLMGITDYSLILVQTTRNITEHEVTAIRNAVGEKALFHDRREQRTSSTYMAFVLFVYGFLGIVSLVTLLNIMNSISMSVSARMKQYGAMREVGMDEQQLTKMIAAEAITYVLLGCITGCVIGLIISKLLYDILITAHFSYAVWRLPVVPLIVILLFIFIATVAAIFTPIKRIVNLSVTKTLHES